MKRILRTFLGQKALSIPEGFSPLCLRSSLANPRPDAKATVVDYEAILRVQVRLGQRSRLQVLDLQSPSIV